MAQYFHVVRLILLILLMQCVQGSNILFVSAPGSASHRRSLFPLAEALGQRGHHVTMVAELFEPDDALGKNITNKFTLVKVDASGHEDALNDIIWKSKTFSPITMIFPWTMCAQMTQALLDQKRSEFDDIARADWDVIFVDALFTPAGLLYVKLINKPYVLFQTTAIGPPEATYRSTPYPVSTFPAMFVQSFDYDHKRFVERLSSLFSELQYVAGSYIVDYIILRPEFRSIIPSISLEEFYGEAASSFVDYPLSLDYPRAITHDTVSIGGNCKTAALKDKDLLDFVEDPSSKGTIVLAFGHMVKWEVAPDDVKLSFAKALNRLTEFRIFWQYKGTPPLKMADHVRTMGWLPQTELLNHAKTKVFVSHGGLKSVMEGICAEVPMILVPFFAEQIRNAFLLRRANAGVMLDKHNLTDDNVVQAIRHVANERSFRRGISDLKWSILDKPITPKENGIFWTEFLVRHQGMPKKWFQLKSYKMCWFTYYNVDVLLAFSAIFLTFSFVLIKLTKFALSLTK